MRIGMYEVTTFPGPEVYSCVYFIQNPENGLIKIGYSVDPDGRMRTIQYELKTRLVMLTCLRGNRKTEKEVHGFFVNARVKANGFLLSKKFLISLQQTKLDFNQRRSHDEQPSSPTEVI